MVVLGERVPRAIAAIEEKLRLRTVVRTKLDHLLRLAMQFCGHCDMDEQFHLGVDLMIRGLETECPRSP